MIWRKSKKKSQNLFSSLNLYFFLVLGLELRAYTLSQLYQSFFVKGFFKIGSCKLFAQAGFEP
jgi:hypothetical protein